MAQSWAFAKNVAKALTFPLYEYPPGKRFISGQ